MAIYHTSQQQQQLPIRDTHLSNKLRRRCYQQQRTSSIPILELVKLFRIPLLLLLLLAVTSFYSPVEATTATTTFINSSSSSIAASFSAASSLSLSSSSSSALMYTSRLIGRQILSKPSKTATIKCPTILKMATSTRRDTSTTSIPPPPPSSSNESNNNKMKLTTGNLVQKTLDPCVILMKQIIAKHQHLWTSAGGIYSLAQGVVYWSPPPTAYQAMVDAIGDSNDLHQYCPDEGLDDLVAALKVKLARENNLPPSSSASDDDNDNGNDTTDPLQLIVTSGANQAYMNCILTLLSDNNDTTDTCVVFKPYYFNHVMAIQMTRGDDAMRVGPLDEDGVPSVDWLREQFSTDDHSIKMVTVVNPGNPTGVSIPHAKLQKIVDVCGEFGVWLVMDNTYEQFDHTGVNAYTNTNNDNNVPGFHCFHEEHVLNIFSFSKGYAMAGFRVGYIAINTTGPKGRDAYRQMLKVQDTIPICASRISQIAALGALDVGRGWVKEKVETLGVGRDVILKALEPLGECMGGSGAMYVMGKLPDGMDDLEAADMLVKKHGVAVIPGSFCGYPGWIRVCYSNLPPDKCIVAADRLAKGILELCSTTT